MLALVNETNQTCKVYLHKLFTEVYSTRIAILGRVCIVVYLSTFFGVQHVSKQSQIWQLLGGG